MRFLTGLLTIVLLGIVLVAWIMLPSAVLLALLVLLGVALLVTRRGRQALQVTRVGISTLPQRLGSSSVILVGIAGVVGVLVVLLAMASGFEATLKATGSNDSAIVLRAGSYNELSSGIDRASSILIARAPGIAKDAQDNPIASPELVVIINLPKKSTGTTANVQLRGVGPEAWALHPHLRMIKGRRFTPGLRELVVGKGAETQFAGLGIGSKVLLGRQPWTVVGEFDAGDAHDSELWGDAETVASAYRRNGFQSVSVRLGSPADFARFKAALLSNPQLKVDVETTRAYYAKQSAGLTKVIRVVGITVAAIMAIGAIFGALNTMYAAVAARTREIATLRAIGFTGLPVVISVLLETMLLAALGGVLGGLIAWLIFDNYTVSTLGANFSQVVFQFRITPALLVAGLKWALAIGFVGGLFPALRAARLVNITS
ncbi:MAG: ABC transporter permease [Steroidobacteraceae bacterium]|nr:ABC transporter permease [Steroidobacteraceae bacterium]